MLLVQIQYKLVKDQYFLNGLMHSKQPFYLAIINPNSLNMHMVREEC